MATPKKSSASFTDLDQLCVNTIRFLSVDAVEKAASGHPGLPLGAAPMAYVLWTRFLRFNPFDPEWVNRDRFVLSAGHGSMLLYSLLHLTGYDLTLDDIRAFRQWGSKTPGHPERGLTPGVEVTTGPLGQGLGNAVGMAAAEAHLAAQFDRPGFDIVNHRTYVIASDGDLMEGVASEAASLAGHLNLSKLTVLYDDNRVSLSATTNVTFTEDRAARFRAYGWRTYRVEDGNDLAAIQRALRTATKSGGRGPALILVRTHLGYGAPHKQDTYEAHGAPLGAEETRLTKRNLGWPEEPPFHIPPEALKVFRQRGDKGARLQAEWQKLFSEYAARYPDLAEKFHDAVAGDLPEGWEEEIPAWPDGSKPEATRTASGTVMNKIAPHLAHLVGGSADLDPSTFTQLKGLADFEAQPEPAEPVQGTSGGGWSFEGNNFHFGVREHGMGAILNGMAAHGGLIPYGSTFLIFSDYMRPPIRLAALMKLQVIYVFTHDSIAVGEDGPTHQPVEQLLGLRAVPGLTVIRPADANETAHAWRVAIGHRDGPVALILSRQKLPVLGVTEYPQIQLGVQAGGYVLAYPEGQAGPELVIVATGAEVHPALEAHRRLTAEGSAVQLVSLPAWNIFVRQPEEYRSKMIPPGVPILAVEAGTPLGWTPYVGPQTAVIGVDRFGASAPGDVTLRQYGITADNIVRHARDILAENRKAAR
jgi:transketolase